MYKCKHHKIHELVPKHIFKKRGGKAWRLLNEGALITLDALRERYGTMYLNNYFWGGNNQWKGLRTPGSSYYSETSPHAQGCAFDPSFKNISAEDIRQDILDNPHLFPYINSLELDVGWVHFATDNCKRIRTYKP